MNANLCMTTTHLVAGLELSALLWVYEKYFGKTPKWVTKAVQSMQLPTLTYKLLCEVDSQAYYKEVHIKCNPDEMMTFLASIIHGGLLKYQLSFARFTDYGFILVSYHCPNTEDLQTDVALYARKPKESVSVKWHKVHFNPRDEYPMPSWY